MVQRKKQRVIGKTSRAQFAQIIKNWLQDINYYDQLTIYDWAWEEIGNILQMLVLRGMHVHLYTRDSVRPLDVYLSTEALPDGEWDGCEFFIGQNVADKKYYLFESQSGLMVSGKKHSSQAKAIQEYREDEKKMKTARVMAIRSGDLPKNQTRRHLQTWAIRSKREDLLEDLFNLTAG
jgi:hypothetical protein